VFLARGDEERRMNELHARWLKGSKKLQWNEKAKLLHSSKVRR
jgi:hypothetical protein